MTGIRDSEAAACLAQHVFDAAEAAVKERSGSVLPQLRAHVMMHSARCHDADVTIWGVCLQPTFALRRSLRLSHCLSGAGIEETSQICTTA